MMLFCDGQSSSDLLRLGRALVPRRGRTSPRTKLKEAADKVGLLPLNPEFVISRS